MKRCTFPHSYPEGKLLLGYLPQFTNGSPPQLVASSSNFMLPVFQQGNLQKQCLSSTVNNCGSSEQFQLHHSTHMLTACPALCSSEETKDPNVKEVLQQCGNSQRTNSVLPRLTRAAGALWKLCR